MKIISLDFDFSQLQEHFCETENLKIENFLPQYTLVNLSSNKITVDLVVEDIRKKIERDWLYHISFLKIVDVVSELGTCSRRKVGAVLTRDRRILATGFNGTPPGAPHCNEEICPGKNAPSGTNLSLCAAVHAEENCLLYCAKYGVIASDSVLYCSCEPCDDCMKLVETVGIKMVVYRQPYPTKMSALRKYYKAKTICIDDLLKEYKIFSKNNVSFNM